MNRFQQGVRQVQTQQNVLNSFGFSSPNQNSGEICVSFLFLCSFFQFFFLDFNQFSIIFLGIGGFNAPMSSGFVQPSRTVRSTVTPTSRVVVQVVLYQEFFQIMIYCCCCCFSQYFSLSFYYFLFCGFCWFILQGQQPQNPINPYQQQQQQYRPPVVSSVPQRTTYVVGGQQQPQQQQYRQPTSVVPPPTQSLWDEIFIFF